MDEKTYNYYETHYEELTSRYESVVNSLSSHFLESFRPNTKILDIGCGSGRDLALLIRNGFDAFGVEPVSGFINQAEQFHPELKGRIAKGQLPNLGFPHGFQFDGILCSAVMMHLAPSQLPESIQSIHRCLVKSGRLLISLPNNRTNLNSNFRDENGRLFSKVEVNEVEAIFNNHNFRLLRHWVDEDGLKRSGTDWNSFLFESL